MSWMVIEAKRNIVYLKDLDDGVGKTITNEAERVLSFMASAYPGHKVVYKDTNGEWWRIYWFAWTDGAEVKFERWYGEAWHILSK